MFFQMCYITCIQVEKLFQFRSTSWSLLRRTSTIRRPSSMFASTNENFWSIWSINECDQIRHSPFQTQDRDFHGCTGSPFKRPQSSPTSPQQSISTNLRNSTLNSTIRSPTSHPTPILKKSLVKVKSDSSLPSTPILGNDLRRHQNVFSASPSRYIRVNKSY